MEPPRLIKTSGHTGLTCNRFLGEEATLKLCLPQHISSTHCSERHEITQDITYSHSSCLSKNIPASHVQMRAVEMVFFEATLLSCINCPDGHCEGHGMGGMFLPGRKEQPGILATNE